MKVALICFDFGGTLLQNPFEGVMKYQINTFHSILKSHGYSMGREDIVYAWREADSKIQYPFISHFFQERDIVMNMLERLSVKENKPLIVSELLAAYRRGLMVVIKNDKSLENVRGVLERLRDRGKQLAVLSSERTNALDAMVRWAGLDVYFSRVIATEGIGIDKPDPRVFWFMLKMLNRKKEEVVYVGDSYFYDVVPAKRFGMKVIWLKRKEEKADAKYRPDEVIKDLGEITGIIE